MHIRRGVIASVLSGLIFFIAHVTAQGPPQPPPAGAAQPPGGRGGGQGRGGQTFPAQQRPLADPAVIARGQTSYAINCRACHGADLRGGDIGGPNLLRSQLVLNDQHGELMLPVIRNGRQEPGMPPMPPMRLPDDEITAVAEYIHSVAATMRGQGSPPAGAEAALNIVVGDAAAGQAYFASKCGSCHSATGNLQGIATRIPDPMQLQNLWITGGGGGRGGGRGRGGAGADAPAATARQVMVTVTPPSGPSVEGRLDRLDDFMVVLTTADGAPRSFTRNGDVPKVDVRDPLETHKKLLTVYTDKDIHDVTAYLVTLK